MTPPFNSCSSKTAPPAVSWSIPLLVLWLIFGTSSVVGQEPDPPEQMPGLVLRAGGSERTVDRPFFSSASSLAEATGLQWSGDLEMEADGEYQLGVLVCGAVQIKVDGVVRFDAAADSPRWIAGESFSLNAGIRPFVVTLGKLSNAKATTTPAQLNVFWRGPKFRWEPLPADRLSHAVAAGGEHPDKSLGADLVRALRCEVCHTLSDQHRRPLASPSLQQSARNLRHDWLRRFFDRDGANVPNTHWGRGMRNVHARFDSQQATDLIAWLQSLSAELPLVGNDDVAPGDEPANQEAGRELIYSQGCLACHTYQEIGNAGPYGGGSLSELRDKRPPGFVRRWLSDPAMVNSQHRMPQFELTAKEVRRCGCLFAAADRGQQSRRKNRRKRSARTTFGRTVRVSGLPSGA